MMQYKTPASVSISASAGYGKTEILCMRLLAIYLADPANIRKTAAMTFTRSAAGEMLERTFMLAAGGLADRKAFEDFRKKMAELNQSQDFLSLKEEELSGLLLLLAQCLSELNISTIDSFMISMAESCPMELGFFRQPTLVSEEQSKGITSELVREIFSAADSQIISACRESLIGREKRQYAEACRELLLTLENSWDLMPEQDAWGRIPDGEMTDPALLEEALKACDEAPPAVDLIYQERLRPLLAHCASIRGAAEYFSAPEIKILDKFFSVWDDFPAEKPDGFKRGWEFANCAGPMKLLLSRARDILLIQAGVRTQAGYKLLSQYRELYRKRMWQRGLIQFADLPKLLSTLPEGDLADLQYRMNLKFRHFLFDEFQDTSHRQWQVFSQIVQDHGEDDHSLFLVGDIKQAIYSWRGGDSRLMKAATLANHLPVRPLPCAFRYGQAICDALNHLFIRGVADCTAIKPDVRRRWQEEFLPHKPFKDRPGHFAVTSLMPSADGSAEDFLEDAARLIAARLREIGAKERKLNCAILVRNNEKGIQLRNALSSQPGFEAADFIWEGDESIACDRVNCGLLALLYYLQHPADTQSAELLRMDPVLQKLLPETPEDFAAANGELSTGGLSRYLCNCFRKIAGLTGDTPGESADALLAAAREFENTDPQCDMASFRDFARQRKRSEAALAGKIRLMSIHHSKGLTFDVTFCPMFPDPHGNFRNMENNGILMGSNWLLHQVGAAGLTMPSIRRAAEERDSIRKFESLCLLYVALTRSKYEVQVLLPALTTENLKYFHPSVSSLKRFKECLPLAEKKKSFYAADLLFDAFFFDPQLYPPDRELPFQIHEGCRYLRREFGTREWYREMEPEKPKKPVPLFPLPPPVSLPQRPLRAAPSKQDQETFVQFRFPGRSGDRTGGTAFGTEVHAFFEKVGKWQDFVPPPETRPEILDHWHICAGNPEIAQLLNEDCELWRERRFDIILRENGKRVFLSGCFDRVQILRNEAGTPVTARIIDFKSNDIQPEDIAETAGHYSLQMDSYRRALAQMLHLPPEKISTFLLFTKIGALHRIEHKA